MTQRLARIAAWVSFVLVFSSAMSGAWGAAADFTEVPVLRARFDTSLANDSDTDGTYVPGTTPPANCNYDGETQAYFANGINGSGICFAGSGDFAEFDDIPNLAQSFTVEAWVLAETSGAIVSRSCPEPHQNLPAFELAISPSGAVGFTMSKCTGIDLYSVVSDQGVVFGGWKHIAVTHSGIDTSIFVYPNTVQGTSEFPDLDPPADVQPGASDSPVRIGASTYSVYPFAGVIDDLRIYPGGAMSYEEVRCSRNPGVVSPVLDQDDDDFCQGTSMGTSAFYNAIDCDDTNSSRFPGAPEICNDLDDDCDGPADEGLAQQCACEDDPGSAECLCGNAGASAAEFWDTDGDGVPDCADCDPNDPLVGRKDQDGNCGRRDCEAEVDQDCCEEEVGKPVNVATGEVTYAPLRPDASVVLGGGSLDLVRRYSSKKALKEIGRYRMDRFSTWSDGWYTQFDHFFYVSSSAPVTHTYQAPDGSEEQLVFDSATNTYRGVTHPAVFAETVGSQQWLHTLDGMTVKFALINESDVGFDVLQPVEIVESGGRTLTLEYYKWTPTHGYCKSGVGRGNGGELCAITSGDGGMIYFYDFGGYDYCTYPGEYLYCTDCDCSASSGGIGVREVRFGRGTDPEAFTERVRYDYASYWPSDTAMLAKTTREVWMSGAFQAVDSENYEYTRLSYQRPELSSREVNGETYSNPYAVQGTIDTVHNSHGYTMGGVPITMLESVPVDLLRRVRNHAGEFVEGHEYDAAGRGATSESAGEFLRFEYYRISANEHRTVVTNESTGGVIEYRIVDGRVVGISDANGCAARSGDLVLSDGRVSAKRTLPTTAFPQGTWTTFKYDTLGRVTLQQDNWDSAQPEVRATAGEASANPVRVRAFEYQGLPGAPATKESRVYSVLWPRGQDFGLTSPGTFAEPGLARDFDIVADDQYNQAPTSRVHREIEIGLTVAESSWTTVVEERHIRTVSYVGEAPTVDPRIAQTVDAEGMVTDYVYYPAGSQPNDLGRLKQIKLNGVVDTEFFDYDAQGRPGRTVDGSGIETHVAYDDAGRVTEILKEVGEATRTTTQTYTAAGRLDTVTSGGVTRRYYYQVPNEIPADSVFFCETQQGPKYPTSNDPLRLVRLKNYVNGPGAPALTQADIEELHANCLEDLGWLGRVWWEETGLGTGALFSQKEKTEYGYSPDGRQTLASVISSDQVTRRKRGAVYDVAGRFIREQKFVDSGTSAGSSFVRDLYPNALGQIELQTPFSDATTAPSHDDNSGNARTETQYDALGRVWKVIVGRSTPAETTTTYEYDTHDNLARVTVGTEAATKRVTDYLYDDFGRVVLVRSPDSAVTRFVYDAVGNVLKRKDGTGAETAYVYDPRHRVIAATHTPDASADVFYYYDLVDAILSGAAPDTYLCGSEDVVVAFEHQVGRLAWVQHGAGATYYSYTAFGELAAEYDQSGPYFDACLLKVTRYTYDDFGRLGAITYPSGRTIRYVRGATDVWPSSIQLEEGSSSDDVVTDLEYDVGGTTKRFMAGLVEFNGDWDLAGQTKSRGYEGASGDQFNWTVGARYASGDIQTVGDTANMKSLALTYDGQDRVASATGTRLRGYENCSYLYGATGNRATETCYSKAITYGYQVRDVDGDGQVDDATNRLTSLSWTTEDLTSCGNQTTVSRIIGPDAVGRITNGYLRKFPISTDAYTLGYDGENRVKGASTPTGTYAYSYDHRSLRAKKIGPAAVTRFVYDGSGRLLSEDDGTSTREYVYLQGEPVLMVVDDDNSPSTPAVLYVLGTDHQGTPMRAFDHGLGDVAWAADYEAFGRAWEYVPESSATPAVEVGLRFPGQYEDKETKLHYNWHRYYDPDTGRYLQPDPLGIGGGEPTLYAYAAGNPLRFADPEGLYIFTTLNEFSGYEAAPGSEEDQFLRRFRRVANTRVYDVGYDVWPCLQLGDTWFFDAFVDYSVAVFWRPGAMGKGSVKTPDLTVGRHEEEHMTDVFSFLDEMNINQAIPTEGFRCREACQAQRSSFEALFKTYMQSMDASSRRRDR